MAHLIFLQIYIMPDMEMIFMTDRCLCLPLYERGILSGKGATEAYSVSTIKFLMLSGSFVIRQYEEDKPPFFSDSSEAQELKFRADGCLSPWLLQRRPPCR